MHVANHLTLQSHGGRLTVAGRTMDCKFNSNLKNIFLLFRFKIKPEIETRN